MSFKSNGILEYISVYGDVKNPKRDIDLMYMLPLALMSMGEDNTDFILAESEALEKVPMNDFYKCFVSYSDRDLYEAAYSLSAKAVSDMTEEGNFNRISQLLKFMLNESGDGILQYLAPDFSEFEEASFNLIEANPMYGIEVNNDNFYQFTATYGTHWCINKILAYRLAPELLKEDLPYNYPMISLFENVIEGDLSLTEWIGKYRAEKDDEVSEEELEVANELIQLFDRAQLAADIPAGRDPAEKVCNILYAARAHRPDMEMQAFQRHLLQNQTYAANSDAYEELRLLILHIICVQNPVIARRALTELKKNNFAGPNLCVLQSLSEAYWMFDYADRTAISLDKYCLEEDARLEKKEENLKKGREQIEMLRKELKQIYDEMDVTLARDEIKVNYLEAENARLRKAVTALSRELENTIKLKGDDDDQVVIPEPLLETEVKLPEDILLPSDEKANELKVVIIGGYRPLLAKLKTRFPNWIFSDSTALHQINIPPDSDLVVFFNRFLSHKMYYPCINACRKYDLDTVYIGSTNEEIAADIIKKKLVDLNN